MRADAISFSALTITARKDSERQLVLAKFRPAPEFDTLIDFGPDPAGKRRWFAYCCLAYAGMDGRPPHGPARAGICVTQGQLHVEFAPSAVRSGTGQSNRQDAKRTGIDGGLLPISETRAPRHTHQHRITGRRLPLTRVGDRTRRLSSEFAIPRNPSCLLPPNGSTASSPA
jgi:hypothetical protein